MLQRFRKARSDDGFTLTELLITIIILGVLAGIVVFAVSAFSDDGTAAACKSDRKNVETAVEAYYAQKRAYPQGANAADNAGRLATLAPSYIKQTPDNKKYSVLVDQNGVVTVGNGTGPGNPAPPPGC